MIVSLKALQTASHLKNTIDLGYCVSYMFNYSQDINLCAGRKTKIRQNGTKGFNSSNLIMSLTFKCLKISAKISIGRSKI